MPPIFAVVDCNNFFVSCERVFDPSLQKRPVIVLSNNDGCIVSRSNEAKECGIPMGAPLFEVADIVRKKDVAVFSANFMLYGDMSQRVMDILSKFVYHIEVYSIDEAFLRLDDMAIDDLQAYGEKIRSTILRWTGLPVSVGIGPSKTLAKVAAEIAKKDRNGSGVLDLTHRTDLDELLDKLEVGDVWGIGRQWSRLLERHGIYTAKQLKQTHEKWIRKQLGVVGLRTVLELNGIACLRLETSTPPRKGIISSRSFGRPVTTLPEMKEAVALYASRAAEKLREQGSVAGTLSVYITTNRFTHEPQYANSATINLPIPTNYTPDLIRYAHECLVKIFRSGYRYKKAVVSLNHISNQNKRQLSLFTPNPDFTKQAQVMQSLDRINQQWGDHLLQSAAVGVKKAWKMKQAQRSPRYTTHWEELPTVFAK